MFLKINKFILLIGVLLAAGFGCKGLSTTQQQAVAPVTLEYWTVFDDVDALQKQIDAFRASRPYITINLKQLRAEELYPRLVEALAEDKGPDIISVRNRAVGMYATKLAPLPASINDTTVINVKTAIGTNDTQITTIANPAPTSAQIDSDYVQTVKKDVVRNGKIYGLPLSMDTLAIYYNKDLLDRSGVATPPKTWEEFQAASKKITRFDKQSGKILQSGAALGASSNVPGIDDILYILLKQSGIDMMDKNGNARFNSASTELGGGPVASVLDFYTDFANPLRDTYAWNNQMPMALDTFVNGQVGFFFGYSYHTALIKARAPQLNFGVIPFLQLNPESPVNAANYWVQSVVSKSRHQNEAWDLLLYLTHSDATKKYLTDSVRPTALRAFVKDQQTNLELAPFAQNVLVSDNWYRGQNYDAALKAVQDMAAEWLALPANSDRPEADRQQVLDRAAAKINQTL